MCILKLNIDVKNSSARIVKNISILNLCDSIQLVFHQLFHLNCLMGALFISRMCDQFLVF